MIYEELQLPELPPFQYIEMDSSCVEHHIIARVCTAVPGHAQHVRKETAASGRDRRVFFRKPDQVMESDVRFKSAERSDF